VSTTPAEASPVEAHDAAARGEAVVIDVREPWENQRQRIAGAVLIPMAQVPARLDEIPRDRDVYVHCQVGARSARVVEYLRSKGWDRAVNVAGGLDAWVQAGLPVEP
jgi:sulfur-carrier protein adenylyltransferase/sulfurtransferase